MKIDRVLKVSPRAVAAIICPATEKALTTSPAREIISPEDFSQKMPSVYRWRVEGMIYSNRQATPNYATHISNEIGRTAQEAWSRFVYFHARLIPDSKVESVMTYACALVRPTKASKAVYPIGAPLFPSVFVQDTGKPLDVSALPRSKPILSLITPKPKTS